MNRIHRHLTVFLLVLAAVALAQSALASTVTLTTADPGGGFAPDIPVYAYHFYGAPANSGVGPFTYTIQNVAFQPFDITLDNVGGGVTTVGSLTFKMFSAPGSYESSVPTVSLGGGSNNSQIKDMLTNQVWYSDENFAGQHRAVQLIAGGLTPGSIYQIDVLVYGDHPTNQSAEFSFLGQGSPIVEPTLVEVQGNYYDVVEDVVADSSGQITVDFLSTGASNTDLTGENPRLGAISVSLVPEPCTASLAGVGGLLLLGRRRRIAA